MRKEAQDSRRRATGNTNLTRRRLLLHMADEAGDWTLTPARSECSRCGRDAACHAVWRPNARGLRSRPGSEAALPLRLMPLQSLLPPSACLHTVQPRDTSPWQWRWGIASRRWSGPAEAADCRTRIRWTRLERCGGAPGLQLQGQCRGSCSGTALSRMR